MLGSQLLEGAPVHPLGFLAVAIEDARLPLACRGLGPLFVPAGNPRVWNTALRRL